MDQFRVFSWTRVYGKGWGNARDRAANRYEAELGVECPWGFRRLRIHDLRHTFGRRVRAAGWSNEDRKDLLGHKNGDITTHYSRVEIDHLRAVVESIVRQISYFEGGRGVGNSAKSLKKWWLRPDLNRGPHHYEYDRAILTI